jgi:hypothetical protein
VRDFLIVTLSEACTLEAMRTQALSYVSVFFN